MLKRFVLMLLAALLAVTPVFADDAADPMADMPYYGLFADSIAEGVWYELPAEWGAMRTTEEEMGFAGALIVADEEFLQKTGLCAMLVQATKEYRDAGKPALVGMDGFVDLGFAALGGDLSGFAEEAKELERFTVEGMPAVRVEMLGQNFEMVYILDGEDLYFLMFPVVSEENTQAMLKLARSLHIADPDAEVATPEEAFTWTEKDGEITITAYTGDMQRVSVPVQIDGKPVTAIGDQAFYETAVRWVHIPDGVKTIGAGCFSGCNNLQTIRLPEGLEAIPAGMFESCFRLHNATVPEGVVRIGESAFYHNYYLDHVQLPSTLEEIGQFNFSSCFWLDGFTLPENCAGFITQDEGTVLLSRDGKRLVCYAAWQDRSSYTVPAGVEIIDPFAFDDCVLEEIVFPEGVKEIGGGALFRDMALAKVTIPASCDRIGVLTAINGKTGKMEEGEIVIASTKHTVVGVPGSAAEAYAQKYGLTFEPLN